MKGSTLEVQVWGAIEPTGSGFIAQLFSFLHYVMCQLYLYRRKIVQKSKKMCPATSSKPLVACPQPAWIHTSISEPVTGRSWYPHDGLWLHGPRSPRRQSSGLSLQMLSKASYDSKNSATFACVHAKLPQSCRTLWDALDHSPPGSCPWNSPGKNTGVVCMPSSRGSSLLRDQTHASYVSWIGRWVLYH